MRACSAPRADQEADNGKGTGWRCSSRYRTQQADTEHRRAARPI